MDNLVKVHGGGANYDSDFSDDETQGETSESRLKRKHEEEILQKPFGKARHSQVAHRTFHSNELDREEARNRRAHLISLTAFERHKKFVGDYILYYGGHMADFKRSVAKDKTDSDVLRENHRFLWRDEDEEDMTWEKELAKKYYDKLFKEYCIADLSRYKENKFGFRWRTDSEVVSGKGLCPECSFKLNYHHKRKEVKAKKMLRKEPEENQEPSQKKTKKRSLPRSKKHKHRRHRERSGSSSSSEESQGKESEPEDEPECRSESDHWRGPAPAVEEKSREEEFDDYFEDLFL
ncbi:protein FRA10AC1 isoform X1 [Phyllopteryx taeniolatus]|uniref:protein FRA10AC1 isoform X1 n=1 Tax=Phyllopteryx taeniolatus TaxID=161469 RepID=UPI002AD52CEC|nr:protein FRA10AC1 isoform X1 [Phyllopteryx taeniolatus]